jgi:hypothetical protein
MPNLDTAFAREAQKAIELVRAGERIRVLAGAGSELSRTWPASRMEALYELAYLRIFVAWEVFLEATFLRYLCGYSSVTHGQAALVSGITFYSTLQAAELAVLGKQQYFLWHNPTTVVNRCKGHILNGRHELVISSNLTRMQYFGDIRHRIAHLRDDVKQKFDTVTTNLATKTYKGSQPGRFLRDWVSGSSPATRWLEAIAGELTGLAGQII